jgi:predicted enzyme related to lactoylglutathione lyase
MPTLAKFIWYDLMTPDPAAALAFYGAVFGWTGKDGGVPDRPYTVLSAGEVGVGGIMAWSQEGQHPGWIGYVGVDDVDAYAQRLTAAGGKIHHAAEDIPGVGRFCVVADPGGAAFILFKGNGADMPGDVAPGAVGRVGWRELHALDREQAFAFYAGLFGWTRGDAIDMGPYGIYQIFAAAGAPVGGMMTKTESEPVAFWRFYVNVDRIGEALSRVRAAGGAIQMDPQQVPGGSWVALCQDPQGGSFAMVSMVR